ncbi:MAG: prolipoprotein diacylglyceryl transferase [Chthonomonadales bacterium]
MHPILFHLGSFPVRSYGVMVLVGFLMGLWYASAAARRRLSTLPEGDARAVSPDHVADMALVGLFVAIAGARALYVLLDLDQFRGHWMDVFKVWTGGLSIHGAIVCGIAYVWWYSRRHHLNFLAFADLCAPAFALGYAIGRVGCFLNGCCYGAACNLPWAVRFQKEGEPGVLTPPSHPTQLYATAMNLVWFVLLDRWSRRPHRDGEIFVGYLALYCVYRFIDEQFRKGATADVFIAGFTHAQVFSAAALPVLLVILWRMHRTSAPEDGVERAPQHGA